MLDLDGFKNVNDTFGHLFVDYILFIVIGILIDLASDNILVSRFGGDEFLIFIKSADKKSVNHIASHLNKHISEIDAGAANHLSASIGAIITEDIVSDYNLLVKTADKALYEVKIAGRNGYLIKEKLSI